MTELSDKQKNLSKMMIVYQMMYGTKKRTKAVETAVKKFQRSFRGLMDNQASLWHTARNHQIKTYGDAWEDTVGKDNGQLLSIGLLITRLYQSCDMKVVNKWIGPKVMEKVMESYYFARLDDVNPIELEEQTNKLVDKLLELYDGKKGSSTYHEKMMLNRKDMILEGIDPEKNLQRIRDAKKHIKTSKPV